jgi:hypothetical protein
VAVEWGGETMISALMRRAAPAAGALLLVAISAPGYAQQTPYKSLVARAPDGVSIAVSGSFSSSSTSGSASCSSASSFSSSSKSSNSLPIPHPPLTHQRRIGAIRRARKSCSSMASRKPRCREQADFDFVFAGRQQLLVAGHEDDVLGKWEIVGAQNTSKYDPVSNRCYGRIYQHITKPNYHFDKEYDQLYDLQIDDLLASAWIENAKRNGMLRVKPNTGRERQTRQGTPFEAAPTTGESFATM